MLEHLARSAQAVANSHLITSMVVAGCAGALGVTTRGLHTASPGRPRSAGAASRITSVPSNSSSSSLAAPRPSPIADLLASAAAPRTPGQAALLHAQASTSAAATPLLDADAISQSLALTWLTHWRAVEEEARLRAAIAEATRGRQRRRHQELLASLTSSSLSLGSSSCNEASTAESSSDAEAVAELRANAREVTSTDPSRQRLEAAMAAPATRGAASQQQQQQQARPSMASQASDVDVDELAWLASHPPESLPGSAPPHEEAVGAAAGGQMRSWAAQAAAGLVQPVQLRVGWESVSVRPLWISVLQQEGSSSAKLFESLAPLHDGLVDRLSLDLTPFAAVQGLKFSQPDEEHGPWRSYFVGLVGEVAVTEDEILWPNQVLHQDRVLYNVRSAWDVAKFLADPISADVHEHRENLERLAAERGYRRGWCWHMLRTRWGEAALRALGISKPAFAEAT